MPGIKGEYIYDKYGNIIGATGGKKTAQTIRERHGKDFYKRIGALGGKKSTGGGFAKYPELAREAGRIGGSLSKRKKRAV